MSDTLTVVDFLTVSQNAETADALSFADIFTDNQIRCAFSFGNFQNKCIVFRRHRRIIDGQRRTESVADQFSESPELFFILEIPVTPIAIPISRLEFRPTERT